MPTSPFLRYGCCASICGEQYQRAAIVLAKNGFVVLCFDPIGQGKRRQLLDADGEPVVPGTTTEHMVEGIAPILWQAVASCFGQRQSWT